MPDKFYLFDRTGTFERVMEFDTIEEVKSQIFELSNDYDYYDAEWVLIEGTKIDFKVRKEITFN